MQHALDAFLTAAGSHPAAALAFIALVAFAESLAIIGTFIPAAIVMFGAGILVGHGTLELAWALGIAAAGAVAGDALSYELGRHQQDRVRQWPFFRRHEAHVQKAEGLIARHGAMSILMARFTGAARAFVPLLAGFARMSPGKFYATNVASALLWAPAHILPGVVFGASLHLAEQASGRIAVLVLMLALLLWGAAWLARLTIRTLVPLTRVLRARAMRAIGQRDGWWARFLRLLLDPERPGSAALFAGMVVVLGSMWLFLGILEDVVSQDPLVFADHTVFTFLQQLRTEPVDRLMVVITEMGSGGVMIPLIAAVAAWLVARRCWRTAGYWLATAASAELVVQILKYTLGRHRPTALYNGVEQFSFPSGHATISAVVLAYLAFLLARGQSIGWRLAIGATAAIYVALVGFSRLYLGAHWLSDVLGGFSFGLAAVAVSAMVYTQHGVREPLAPKRMAIVAVAVIAIAAGVWGAWRLPSDLERYAQHRATSITPVQAWVSGAVASIPSSRREIAGEQKEGFTLQIACDETTLRSALARAGWQAGAAATPQSMLLFIAPQPQILSLPVISKFDGGRRSTVNFVESAAGNTRNVLRLWQSDFAIAAGVPIWYGAYYRESLVRPDLGLIHGEPQAADPFRMRLEAVGLHELSRNRASGSALELWMCLG